jgi:hypothetical protein
LPDTCLAEKTLGEIRKTLEALARQASPPQARNQIAALVFTEAVREQSQQHLHLSIINQIKRGRASATTSAQTRPFARSTAIATGSKRADQGQPGMLSFRARRE